MIYRIAADLEANLQPALPILPSLGSKRSDSLQIQSQGPPSRDKDTFDDRSSLGTLRIETGPSPPSPSHSYSYSSGGYVPSSPSSPAAAADDTQLRRFCRALRAIEKERLRHREYIKVPFPFPYSTPIPYFFPGSVSPSCVSASYLRECPIQRSFPP